MKVCDIYMNIDKKFYVICKGEVMKLKSKLCAIFLMLAMIFPSFMGLFAFESYADDEYDYDLFISEEEDEEVDLDDEADEVDLNQLNEDYDLGLSDEELKQEAAVLTGARIEEDKAYEIPLMKQATNELALLSEDRAIDMPANLNIDNPQQFFYIGSIGVRIQLLRMVSKFINEMTTVNIYKIQEAHNLTAQICFEAVMVCINPFNGRKDVLRAIDKFESNAEKIRSMRDMTSGDLATVYVKRLMNKNIREARKIYNQSFYQGNYGIRGKEVYIQNIYKSEVNEIAREVNKKITFGQLLELDARLKSATSSVLLSNEVVASNRWLIDVVQPEINLQNRLKSKYRSSISKEDFDIWQRMVKTLTDRRRERDVKYDKVANAVYDLWDFNTELKSKYPDTFTDDDFGNHELYLPQSIIEPYQVASITWIVSPTFDKIPAGMQASGSSIIIGFGSQKAQRGPYESYVSQRASLRDEIITTSMDGENPDLLYPDFTDPD